MQQTSNPAKLLTIKLAIFVARCWRIFVNNLIASHLRKPNLRNMSLRFTQPSHGDLFFTHHACGIYTHQNKIVNGAVSVYHHDPTSQFWFIILDRMSLVQFHGKSSSKLGGSSCVVAPSLMSDGLWQHFTMLLHQCKSSFKMGKINSRKRSCASLVTMSSAVRVPAIQWLTSTFSGIRQINRSPIARKIRSMVYGPIGNWRPILEKVQVRNSEGPPEKKSS